MTSSPGLLRLAEESGDGPVVVVAPPQRQLIVDSPDDSAPSCHTQLRGISQPEVCLFASA